jgi:sporulation protein YlmC with PRC-barrel domain
MTPDSRIKLTSELLDLPILDNEDKYCGIVDDVEFAGSKHLRLKALLVGPGAYAGRMPGWMFWLVKTVAGDHMGRVPMDRIKTIGATVKLTCPGTELGLNRGETAAGRWIPHKAAM